MRKKSKLISWVVLSIIALVLSCKEEDIIPEPFSEPGKSSCSKYSLSTAAEIIYDQILYASQNDCDSCMRVVLDEWANQSVPLSPVPDSLKDAYEIFKLIYQPWDSTVLSSTGGGYIRYNNTRPYYIVPRAIIFKDSCIDFNCKKSIAIHDFSPTIFNDTIGVLYYHVGDYMSAVQCYRENNGTAFLNKYFSVGPYKNTTVYITYPTDLWIYLDNSEDYAIVEYGSDGVSGTAFLSKVSGVWQIDSVNCCAIE